MGGPLAILARNRALAWQLAAMLAATAAAALASGALAGASAAAACAAGGVLATVLFAAFSIRRYAEVGRLSAQLDEVLAQGRRLELADYREGDVAVLGNQVAKVVAQLARTTQQLDREKSLMGDWMADVSHQIRTPLTALSLTAAALERAEGAQERKALVWQLQTMVEQLSWLVTALLRLAKLDADALPLDSRPVMLDALFERATAPLEVALDLRGVRLEAICQPGASFAGDARWTAEALTNIVKNCMEHAPEGSAIRLEGSEDAIACRIRVVDEGPGIAPEDLPHVFERFYRGRPAPQAVEAPSCAAPGIEAGTPGRPDAFNDGFGIGLSLAQALVVAQGGTLRASNEPGAGARFDITFPKLVV